MISAELEAVMRMAIHILGCGLIGGFIRFIRKVGDREFKRVKLLAGLLASCLCSFGGFVIGELAGLPYTATVFLMILFGFFDGRLLEAMDKSLITILEDGSRAIIRILEHRGTKE